jgi:hypothetical protein
MSVARRLGFAALLLGGCAHHELPPPGPLVPEWSDGDARPKHGGGSAPGDEPERSPPLGWQVFNSPDGDFSVWIPGTPREDRAPPTYRRFALDVESGRYVIAAWELDAQKGYTAADDELAKHFASKECDQLAAQDATVHGQAVHVVRERCGDQIIDDARYLAGNRLYHLELITDGDPSAERAENAKTFLGSFIAHGGVP